MYTFWCCSVYFAGAITGTACRCRVDLPANQRRRTYVVALGVRLRLVAAERPHCFQNVYEYVPGTR